MKTDLVTMSTTDLERLAQMGRIAERLTTQREVAEQLGLCVRQVERLYAQYKAAGAPGLVSKRRGSVSNRRLPAELRTMALGLVRANYADFGPTLAHEKLAVAEGPEGLVGVRKLGNAQTVRNRISVLRRASPRASPRTTP